MKNYLLLIVFFVSCGLIFQLAMADTDEEINLENRQLFGNSKHGSIELSFNDDTVTGKIMASEKTFDLSSAKILKSKGRFLIIDPINDIRILGKEISSDRYFILLKFISDNDSTKMRILADSKPLVIFNQRNLFEEMQSQLQNNDPNDLTYKELMMLEKQSIAEKNSEKYSDRLQYMVNEKLKKIELEEKLKKEQEEQEKVLLEQKKLELEKKEQYVPNLFIVVEHDFRTYWNDFFDIEIITYDLNENPNPNWAPFDGRFGNVTVDMTITLNDNEVAQVSGKTSEYGDWSYSNLFKENVSVPGEYQVKVIAKYLNQSVSQTTSMFVIGTVPGGGGTNNTPIADAGSDQSVSTNTLVILDGSGSSDPDGDTITYSWTQTSGESVTLSDSTDVSPTFTSPGSATTLVFEITVTDTGGKSSTDTVTITVS